MTPTSCPRLLWRALPPPPRPIAVKASSVAGRRESSLLRRSCRASTGIEGKARGVRRAATAEGDGIGDSEDGDALDGDRDDDNVSSSSSSDELSPLETADVADAELAGRSRRSISDDVSSPLSPSPLSPSLSPSPLSPSLSPSPSPLRYVSRPLPRVLLLHTGGTLGMDVPTSFVADAVDGHVGLVAGTGGNYPAPGRGGLQPGSMLSKLLDAVPELGALANLSLAIPYNLDSSRVGPREWIKLAKILDRERDRFDAFLVISGTDTMSYVASALSLMLAGYGKPIVITGSQLPLQLPRSDARQNLVDALTCATAASNPPYVRLAEVCVCFGGLLLRGNRAQKVHSQAYRAFASPTYPVLARLGVDVEWDEARLLRPHGAYTPRFELEPRVARVPVVPGADPRVLFGSSSGGGGGESGGRNRSGSEDRLRGVVLEAFGVGNFNDLEEAGWAPWIRELRRCGVEVLLSSQCHAGELRPDLYRSGRGALAAGATAGPRMSPECAVVKMMLCLKYPDLAVGVPLAGEL